MSLAALIFPLKHNCKRLLFSWKKKESCTFVSNVSQGSLGLNGSLLVLCVSFFSFCVHLVLNFLPLKKFGFLLQVLFEAAFEQTVSKAFTKTARMCEAMCAAEGSCCAWLGSALFYHVGVSRRRNFPLVLGSPCLLARCGLERLRGHRVSGALC